MTYGHYLDQAEVALAKSRNTLHRAGTAVPTQLPAVLAARSKTYRALVALTHLLGEVIVDDPMPTDAEYLVSSRARVARTDPALLLSVGLQVAERLDSRLRSSAPSDDPLAEDLSHAANALAIARDILASHLDPLGYGPRTREGQAISRGAGRREGLAEVAHIATWLLAIDSEVLTMLHSTGNSTATNHLYLTTTAKLAWWTGSRYPDVLSRLAESARPALLLRTLAVAPPTEQSAIRPHIRDLKQVADLLQTTRAWLVQHPADTGVHHIRSAARLALTISAAGKLLTPTPLTGDGTARWAAVLTSIEPLADIGGPIHSDISHQLDDAASWLRNQFARSRRFGTPIPFRHEQLTSLATDLPDLADQLRTAMHRLASHRRLLIRHNSLAAEPIAGIHRAEETWHRLDPDGATITSILDPLRRASANRIPQPANARNPVAARATLASPTAEAPEPSLALQRHDDQERLRDQKTHIGATASQHSLLPTSTSWSSFFTETARTPRTGTRGPVPLARRPTPLSPDTQLDHPDEPPPILEPNEPDLE